MATCENMSKLSFPQGKGQDSACWLSFLLYIHRGAPAWSTKLLQKMLRIRKRGKKKFPEQQQENIESPQEQMFLLFKAFRS